MTDEAKRAELVALKERHGLTNRGIFDVLPAGTASLKTVESWSSGHRGIPLLVLKVLKHKLEGQELI